MGHVPLFLEYVVHRILDISDLSFHDFALIVGHYNSIASPTTELTEEDFKKMGYNQAVIDQVSKHKKKDLSSIESMGLRFKPPLSRFNYPLFDYIFTLFANYERGALPFPGSVSEQPAQIMQAFSLLQALKHERETKLHKELERNNVRQHKNKY